MINYYYLYLILKCLSIYLFTSLSYIYTSEKGYWTNIKVKAYHSQSLEASPSGKSRYGTNLYKEGCAADRTYYPKGSQKGRWFTVDDTHPDTVRSIGLIYLRFLTEQKAQNWQEGFYRIYVERPKL